MLKNICVVRRFLVFIEKLLQSNSAHSGHTESNIFRVFTTTCRIGIRQKFTLIKVFNLQEMHLLKMKSPAIITLNGIKSDIASETVCFNDKNVAMIVDYRTGSSLR